MRKRPNNTLEVEDFLNSSADQLLEGQNDMYKHVIHNKWPILDNSETCSFAEGSNLKKPLILNTNEKEWNTIERHVKALGITKSSWMKYAIFRTIYEEQLAYLKKNNSQ